MKVQERIDQLFRRTLDGTCSPAEWEELLVLVDGLSDQEETALLRPLSELWEKVGATQLTTNAYSIDKEQLYQRITQPKNPTTLPIYKKTWARFAVAASVAGLLVAGAIRYFNRPDQEVAGIQTSISSPSLVPPGTDKAVLTLGDGQQILLDSSMQGSIPNQSATQINNMPGQLVYQQAYSKEMEKVVYNTLTTAKANQYRLVLSDGTVVWLNALSSIRYPVRFTGNDRTVEITGEAYFEVARHSSRPFHVNAGSIEIQVLGTAFNVNAYPDESNIKTSLLEGSVQVRSRGESVVLQPGQETHMEGTTLQVHPANVALAASWKNGYFHFDQATLPQIMRQIGRWYDVNIQYEGKVPNRLFKGKLQRSLPLSGILRLFEKGGIRFKLQGNVLTVLE